MGKVGNMRIWRKRQEHPADIPPMRTTPGRNLQRVTQEDQRHGQHGYKKTNPQAMVNNQRDSNKGVGGWVAAHLRPPTLHSWVEPCA